MVNTYVALPTVQSSDKSVFFNAGGKYECSSICGAGEHGDCVTVGECYSCTYAMTPAPFRAMICCAFVLRGGQAEQL
jgi:hypothetical protein